MFLRQQQVFKNPYNAKKKVSSKSVAGSGGDGLLILFHIAGRRGSKENQNIDKKKLQETCKKKRN